METTPILKKVEAHVSELFEERSLSGNAYHNISHTLDVVEVSYKIAQEEKIAEEEIEILIIASWFHDLGYFVCCEGHEDQSAYFAKEYLEKELYPAQKIEKVIGCIRSTRIPQSPQNKLEEILCDADLHHLGLPDAEEKGNILRLELEKRGLKKFTDAEWIKNTIRFFNDHRFFTEYAIKNYSVQKNLNLLKFEKKIKKLEKKQKEEKLADLKLESEQQKLDSKIKAEKRTERGVETMFRNVMRTHVEFSAMADSKANIMISVNTIMITFIVSFLLRVLDQYPHFIIPSAFLVLTSLITLVYAILVTRPKITEGTFTKDDILQKKSNLLFFGNFYNMKEADFAWGMKSLMDDRDYLYDSMIKDFFHLGQVLGLKYKHLRICYTIFMYGLIFSILLFAIAFVINPEGAIQSIRQAQ